MGVTDNDPTSSFQGTSSLNASLLQGFDGLRSVSFFLSFRVVAVVFVVVVRECLFSVTSCSENEVLLTLLS